DMVELRIDEMADDASNLPRLVSESMLPCIVTCRPTWEGGRSELSNDERLALLDSASPRYVDVELRTLQELRKQPLVRFIVSAHDFQQRPDRLYNLIAEMNVLPADVSKIVWMARTIRDNIEAFEILQNRQKATVALCMAEAGLLSRVLAKKFG